ncbi:MAG: nuclear transport factor 2 family protein [Spongiibacteraceae bacterium]|jgi:hypothetical protein|nr:nuclear transport factor 2 family protein [Spongiibacteraceae bacterium]
MTAQRNKLDKAYMGIDKGLPLQVSEGGIEELRRDIQRLMDIEAIKQLKYAYFRCVDTANLEELATLLDDKLFIHYKGGSYEWKTEDKSAFIENIGASFNQRAVGHHNGHHPEITLLSDTEATGAWYLADVMMHLDHNAQTTGTALYWDRYRKINGRWVISESRYERLYEINEIREKAPVLASHYLASQGRPPAKK